MGVHAVEKYDEVRSALGIPEGEPLFIIRAQDELSIDALAQYRRNYTQSAMLTNGEVALDEIDRFNREMDVLIAQFHRWQQDHPESVKFPD